MTNWESNPPPRNIGDNPAVSPTHNPALLCPWCGFYDRHKSPSQSYQVGAFKPVAPLVYNSTPAFSSPWKHTGNGGTGYGLHPHKSSPPSSPSDRGTSQRISQTRWPHKGRVNVNTVFVIAGVRSFVGGINGVDGRAAVGAFNYHYVNRTSAHSLFPTTSPAKRTPPPRARSGMEAGGEEGVSDISAAIVICSREVFKLWDRCYYTLPQSRLCNVLFAMPGRDFVDGN